MAAQVSAWSWSGGAIVARIQDSVPKEADLGTPVEIVIAALAEACAFPNLELRTVSMG